MTLSESHKFIFIHIPKSAGSSITEALTEKTQYAKTLGDGRHQTLEKIRTLGYSVDGYFSFSFVRNPYDRVKNWFDYINWQLENSKKTRKRLYKKLENFMLQAKTFEGFVRQIPTKDHNDFLFFARTQFEYLSLDGKLAIDFVGKFENLLEDWKVVCQKLRIEKLELPKSKHGMIPINPAQYTDELREIVATHYKEDFETFGYEV